MPVVQRKELFHGNQRVGQAVTGGDLSNGAVLGQFNDGFVYFGGDVAAFAEGDAVFLKAKIVVQVDHHVSIVGAFTNHGQGADTVHQGDVGSAGLDFHQGLGHGVNRRIVAVSEETAMHFERESQRETSVSAIFVRGTVELLCLPSISEIKKADQDADVRFRVG